MPIPKSQNKGEVMRAIKKHHPSWKKDKKVAVMLSQARKSGADIPSKKKKVEALKERAKYA